MFVSFADAPQGLEEELNEINIGTGLEYIYHNLIALRGGYFYEDDSKGGRQMWAAGAGVHFSSFNIDLGYQNSTNQQITNTNATFSMSLQILLNKS
ncbi:MAG: PorV/PorQ family protein [Bacteroidetes bacterium]|nr:PorV/PorQ family protein [Bacteroidota bacterium]